MYAPISRFFCSILVFGILAFSVSASEGNAPAQNKTFDRTAAAQRIQARLNDFHAWEEELGQLLIRQKAGEDVSAQLKAVKPAPLLSKVPQLEADSQRIIAMDSSDDAAFVAIQALLLTDVEHHNDGTPRIAGLAARLVPMISEHFVDRPELEYILSYDLRLDEDNAAKLCEGIYAKSSNRSMRGNAAAYLVGLNLLKINDATVSDEKRAEVRKQALSYAEAIRQQYADVMPNLFVAVPSYLRPNGAPSNYRGPGTPTLAGIVEDRLKMLEHSIGTQMPNLHAMTVSGSPDELAHYRGKVVVIDFWATWCGPCREGHPELAKLKAELQGAPFEVIGVSTDEHVAEVKKYVKTHAPWVNWHVGSSSQMAKEISIQSIPVYLIVDAKGILRERTEDLNDATKALIRRLVEQAKS